MANTGKRYTKEFKSDSIRLIKEDGRSVKQVAKDIVNGSYSSIFMLPWGMVIIAAQTLVLIHK